jgi:hypothetical protein
MREAFMARKNDLGNVVLIGAGAVLAIQILAAQPNCDRGCKNNLEHLTQHILGDVFTAMLRGLAA